MKVAFIQTGKTNVTSVQTGSDDYSGRIKKYVPFEIITIPDIRNTRNMPQIEQKNREGRSQLAAITDDDYVILLDEHGKEYTTRNFATRFEGLLMSGKKRILFLSGGAYGFSEEVYKRADEKLSLSQLTFPHQLVRLLFLEQLYRVFTIIKGEPYHHD